MTRDEILQIWFDEQVLQGAEDGISLKKLHDAGTIVVVEWIDGKPLFELSARTMVRIDRILNPKPGKLRKLKLFFTAKGGK